MNNIALSWANIDIETLRVKYEQYRTLVSQSECIYFYALTISSCSHTMPSAIWEIFSEFLTFCNIFKEPLGEWKNRKTYEARKIIAKYEKQGKYVPILHEATYNNYFIVKCLLKSNVARVILLTNCIELEQTSNSKNLKY